MQAQLPLAERVARVRERIDDACERAGRTDPVTLVAVTKTHPADAVRRVCAAGVADVGENRVGELQDKVGEVGDDTVRWHLIGHLQRNKVRAALPLIHLLHSVDSPRLARAVSDEATRINRVARVLVQVNTSGEAAKYGFAAAEAVEQIAAICELPGVRVEGLMTMAPFTDDDAVLRRTFAAARRLAENAAAQVPAFEARCLSMGMSNDYEIAVEEGSTLVRVGTALFGERET